MGGVNRALAERTCHIHVAPANQGPGLSRGQLAEASLPPSAPCEEMQIMAAREACWENATCMSKGGGGRGGEGLARSWAYVRAGRPRACTRPESTFFFSPRLQILSHLVKC